MYHHTGLPSVRWVIILACACMLAPVVAQALPRSEVIERGSVWVEAKVPYSQSRYATVSGSRLATSTVRPSTKGYRTDCSGFVSMCLGLRTSLGSPLSADTATLPTYLVKIKKSQLRPGDVILRPRTLKIDGKTVPYGHAVLFGGWADKDKTHYYGLHESSSRKGAVQAKIAWGKSGFWTAEGFSAYRYPGVRDRVRVAKTFGSE